MDTEELQMDRTVDPSQLDVEAVRQSDVFYKWAERAIRAKSKADQLDFELKVLEAKLQAQCRADPESFGVTNVTEKAVASAVLCHEKYRNGMLDLIKAREEQALLDKAVQAMEHRKSMLKVLQELYAGQYFTGPAEPRRLTDAWDKYNGQRGEDVNDRQRAVARRRVQREA